MAADGRGSAWKCMQPPARGKVAVLSTSFASVALTLTPIYSAVLSALHSAASFACNRSQSESSCAKACRGVSGHIRAAELVCRDAGLEWQTRLGHLLPFFADPLTLGICWPQPPLPEGAP